MGFIAVLLILVNLGLAWFAIGSVILDSDWLDRKIRRWAERKYGNKGGR